MTKMNSDYKAGWNDSRVILRTMIQIKRDADDPTKDGYYVRKELYEEILKLTHDMKAPEHSR